MPKAVLDTSVLVSAFLTPQGIPGALLAKARSGAFLLYLSREILSETAETLRREVKLQERYHYGEPEVDEFCRGLLEAAQPLVTDLPELEAVPLDPKDNMVVSTAVKAGANYLVSGDKRHILPLGEYQGIKIITARQLLELL
jgi:putative PIN family toxin of toxin-antitoxin system